MEKYFTVDDLELISDMLVNAVVLSENSDYKKYSEDEYKSMIIKIFRLKCAMERGAINND